MGSSFRRGLAVFFYTHIPSCPWGSRRGNGSWNRIPSPRGKNLLLFHWPSCGRWGAGFADGSKPVLPGVRRTSEDALTPEGPEGMLDGSFDKRRPDVSRDALGTSASGVSFFKRSTSGTDPIDGLRGWGVKAAAAVWLRVCRRVGKKGLGLPVSSWGVPMLRISLFASSMIQPSPVQRKEKRGSLSMLVAEDPKTRQRSRVVIRNDACV